LRSDRDRAFGPCQFSGSCGQWRGGRRRRARFTTKLAPGNVSPAFPAAPQWIGRADIAAGLPGRWTPANSDFPEPSCAAENVPN
jgi:hypothetical protein